MTADRVAALGDATHPDVLDARSRLGELLVRTADGDGVEEAVELLTTTETEQTARAGALHPYVLATRARLATALLKADRPAEARALFTRLLPQQREALGPDHAATLRTRNHLSTL